MKLQKKKNLSDWTGDRAPQRPAPGLVYGQMSRFPHKFIVSATWTNTINRPESHKWMAIDIRLWRSAGDKINKSIFIFSTTVTESKCKFKSTFFVVVSHSTRATDASQILCVCVCCVRCWLNAFIYCIQYLLMLLLLYWPCIIGRSAAAIAFRTTCRRCLRMWLQNVPTVYTAAAAVQTCRESRTLNIHPPIENDGAYLEQYSSSIARIVFVVSPQCVHYAAKRTWLIDGISTIAG